MKINRTIKFRIWDTAQKQYLSLKNYQDLGAIEVENDGTLTLSPRYRFLTSMMIMPERFIPQQFTGLKDKNGVEIYEGDIIKTYANYGYGKNIKQVEVISEVIYKVDKEKTMGGLNSNSFSGFKTKQLNNQEYTNVDWSMFFQCEVIGNIYEELKESDD